MRFCPIASGSSGNCIYVGSGDTHILVDAGLSGRSVEKGLSGLNVKQITGVFITHEHSDHISGVGVLARRYHVPIYATPKTWRYLLRHNTIGSIPEEQVRMIEPGKTESIGGMEVTAFDIPHDASQPVGYCLRGEGGCKVSVATDIGHVTDTVRENIRDSHILLLESNHDLEMLKNGRYPKPLKERVMGARGHLSNVSAGMLLAEVASACTQYVFLGHLSEENNRPLLALDTVRNILDGNGIAVKHLTIAERYGPCEMVEVVR